MALGHLSLDSGMALDPVALRVHIYDLILKQGTPPGSDALAGHFGVSAAEARGALAGLKLGKTVLVHPASGEIWMAGPFAAAESPYKIIGSGTTWYANCAWDMLGVANLADEPVRIEARCSDCAELVAMEVEPRSGSLTLENPAEDPLVHFLIPARRWYDDIGFT